MRLVSFWIFVGSFTVIFCLILLRYNCVARLLALVHSHSASQRVVYSVLRDLSLQSNWIDVIFFLLSNFILDQLGET